MRVIVESDPVAFCNWLDRSIEGPVELLSDSFATETLHADLLARVSPRRLVHVEYVRSPTADVAVRILGYRAQIMRRHPGMSITQYAVVLGEGHIRSCDDPENGFALGLRSVYLPESDPATILAHPSLAGLAVLGEGDQETRAKSLITSLQVVQGLPPQRRAALVEAAIVLATISLDRSTIDLIIKETGMTIETVAEFYSGTEVGQEIHKQGLEQGLEQGLARGSAQTLAALLRVRFGDDPRIPAIARGFAQRSGDDASIRAITKASSLDDLPTQSPGSE